MSKLDLSHPYSREVHLLREYGITETEFDALLNKQDGKCKICGGTKAFRGKFLTVDHDHKTGKVRGLLCSYCNSMLSNAKDNQTVLLRAIQYLKGRL